MSKMEESKFLTKMQAIQTINLVLAIWVHLHKIVWYTWVNNLLWWFLEIHYHLNLEIKTNLN